MLKFLSLDPKCLRNCHGEIFEKLIFFPVRKFFSNWNRFSFCYISMLHMVLHYLDGIKFLFFQLFRQTCIQFFKLIVCYFLSSTYYVWPFLSHHKQSVILSRLSSGSTTIATNVLSWQYTSSLYVLVKNSFFISCYELFENGSPLGLRSSDE